MFSSVGGFRFIQTGGLNNGIYLFSGANVVVSGYQSAGGKTYFSGYPSGANTNIVTAQLDSNNATTYARSLSGSSTRDLPYNSVLDTSYNQIVVGITDANTVGNYDMYMSKYDSTGSLQWQRTVGTATIDRAYDLALVDSGANIIVVGTSDGAANAWIGKFESSNGAITNQYTMTNYRSFDSITTDNTGNVCTLVTQNSAPSADGVLALKMQSNFTKTWGQYIQYNPTSANIDLAGSSVVTDSSNNVYVTVRRPTADEDWLLKFNSSGTLQWQTTFNYGTNNGFTATCADNSGNIYIAGNFGSPLVIQLLKIDGSGSIVWGRGLNGYGGTEVVGVENISWYNNKILINGYSFFAGTQYGMILEVPDDGSLVGSYANGYVWGYSPFSTASSNLLVSSSTGPAFSTTTLADSAGTLTDSSTTITITQNIPF